MRALPIIDKGLMRLRAYVPYPSLIRDWSPLFSPAPYAPFCGSIARYGLRIKNPRKATGTDFIPLKVIKFASNVTDSHLL